MTQKKQDSKCENVAKPIYFGIYATQDYRASKPFHDIIQIPEHCIHVELTL